MSYGTGWECDECGQKEIVAHYQPLGYYNTPPMDSVPEGWLIVIGPVKQNTGDFADYHSNSTQQFCSEKCVEDFMYTARKNKAEPTSVTKTGTPVFYSYGAEPSRIAGVIPND